MRCWCGHAGCLHMVQLMPLPSQTQLSLASVKTRVVFPFWYWLTQVVLEKRPLNGCSITLLLYGPETGYSNTNRVICSVPPTEHRGCITKQSLVCFPVSVSKMEQKCKYMASNNFHCLQCFYLSVARCRLAYCPADATTTHCLLLQ